MRLSLIYMIAFFSSFLNHSISGQSVQLVKDITPGPGSSFSFFYDDDAMLFSFKDKVVFRLESSTTKELWISDGVDTNTYVFHSISSDDDFGRFINEDPNFLYYVVNNSEEGRIYSMDKTTLDTSTIYVNENSLTHLELFNGELYFEINGEHQLGKLNLATLESEVIYQFGSFRRIREIKRFNDQLAIVGGESNGTELYISDGTTEGTTPIYQLNEGSVSGNRFYSTVVDDKLFFFHRKGAEPRTLYVTDGTTEGTIPLINLEYIFTQDLEERRAVIGWNGKLFFKGRALDEPDGQEDLFVSDGTVEGTFAIQPEEDQKLRPDYFTVYEDELYFNGTDFSVNNIFKTDGTVEGTFPVVNPNELGGGIGFGGAFLVEHDSVLTFSGFRIEVGSEIWFTEGSTETTFPLDIVEGEEDASPSQLISTDNYLFFTAELPGYGRELVILDPNPISSQEEVFTREQVEVFPNPFDNSIFVKTKEIFGEKLDVHFRSIDGRLIYTHQMRAEQEEIILPSHLPKGLYIVSIIVDGYTVANKKLIKN